MRRRGFQLVEVLLSLVFVTGALFAAASLSSGSARGAQQTLDRIAARMQLADVLEMLAAESPEDLRALCSVEGAAEQLLRARLDDLPPAVRASRARQLEALRGKLRCSFDEDAGGVRGLARLTVSATLPGGGSLTLSRHWRPDAEAEVL